MPKGIPTRTGRILTAEDKAQILREANEPGCNRSALAEKWGCSRAYIYLLLNPCNFKQPAPIEFIGAHEIRKLRVTLRLSLRQFADLMGVSEGNVRGWEDAEHGWQPRAAARHHILKTAEEHGLPLEFLASERTLKNADLEVKNPIGREERRNLKERGRQRQDFRRKIQEPPPEPPVPQAPPPKTVTVGNKEAFNRAAEMFRF